MPHLDSTAVVLSASLSISACQSTPQIIEPACANPARLEGHYDTKAPGFFVNLKSSVPAIEYNPTIERFEREYHVAIQPFPRANAVFFQSHLSPQRFSQLRCDGAIEYIEFNGVTVIGDSRGSLACIGVDRDV